MKCKTASVSLSGRLENVRAEDVMALADFRTAEWNDRYKRMYVGVYGNTFNLHLDGSFILFGTKGMEAAERSMQGLLRMFGMVGCDASIGHFEMVQVTMCCALGHSVDLMKVAKSIPCHYEPDLSIPLSFK